MLGSPLDLGGPGARHQAASPEICGVGWPTTRHLHDDLKRLCGYVDVYHNPLTGRDEVRVQSTAFDKMGESEFAAYFRLAQMRFAQQMGFDPWVMGRAA
ncbi:hypothetical protein [Rhodovulum sp. MB263]|uniref:hypothetical protein n=1 Tax=Rhodovulum sp. (strain MB263) TaxID=308754 RepID=UPI0012DB6C15|nr:hypothetical protein [Rhodovulum sp. MB263]